MRDAAQTGSSPRALSSPTGQSLNQGMQGHNHEAEWPQPHLDALSHFCRVLGERVRWGNACIKERCEKERWAQHQDGSAVVIKLLREKI